MLKIMNNHLIKLRSLSSLLLLSTALLFSSCADDDDSNDSSPTHDNSGPTTVDNHVFSDAKLRKDMEAGNKQVSWQGTIILDGPVYVQNGETLTIAAGTIVKGRAKPEGQTASALIVARGGKIMASGTKVQPIIFTFEEDPIDGSTPPTTRGRWGGVILLGKAGLNSTPGTTSIEGIPTSEERGKYGGTEDNDSSGTLRYVSIRHGGAVIGANNEINGLTLGGVGSGTTLEYIEIVGNKDDGIEFFGGTANVRYLLSIYNADDAVDYDEGYRGFCQFILIHQDPSAEAADRGFECDGGTTPEDGTPFATPLFTQITVRGNSTKRVATIRDNAGGFFYNALFTGSKKGIDAEKTSGTQHSFKQVIDGKLSFRSNAFNLSELNALRDTYKISVPVENGDDMTEDLSETLIQALTAANNKPMVRIAFADKSSKPSETTDFPPAYTIPAAELANYPNHGYQSVDYIGAIDPGAATPWYEGWSFYHSIINK